MTSLQKDVLMGKPSAGLPPKGNFIKGGRARDVRPAPWSRYFRCSEDVRLPAGDVFHVYRTWSGPTADGPLLVLLHGGGYSALTWAPFAERVVQSVHCQVLAVDLRGHGETITADETDLSVERQVGDIVSVVSAVYGGSGGVPPALLVGHSMGGALAVHAAHAWSAGPLLGLVVIDVVEGTALDALGSMHTFLRGRPDRFSSVEHAIQWCLKSGAVRNVESARVSVPGQLRNVCTGKPATRELSAADTSDAPRMAEQPMPPTDSIAEEAEDAEAAEQTESRVPAAAAEQTECAGPATTPHGYTWRAALASSEPHWPGWFSGLSSLFLSAPTPKILLLAGVDRLDRELSVGQMQGKFQLQVVPRSGHAVQEDVPDRVSGVVATFMVRHQLTRPLDGFTTIPPGC